MRIAVVHSHYRSDLPSGEGEVVAQQVEALTQAGHEVATVFRYSDVELTKPAYTFRSAFRVVTGHGHSPSADLARFRPDVVHVHNLFPNFGDSWARRSPAPLIATLHNFRPLCAAGTLTLNGQPCTACPDGSWPAAVVNACYHGSQVASLPLAIRNRRGAEHDRLLEHAAGIVVLSDRARRVYARYGIASERLHRIPNFTPAAAREHAAVDGPWLYAGRLVAEKGVTELLAAWPQEHSLIVAGEGPLREDLTARHPHVQFTGRLSHEEMLELIPSARGLLVPSRWAEGLPQVYLEALAAGVPIIASEGSSAADHVAEHGTGVVVPREFATTDLRRAIVSVLGERDLLAEKCRGVHASQFSVDRWLASMLGLYRSVL